MSDYSELKKRAMDATPGPWYEQDDEDSAAGAVFIMPVSDVWIPPICRITTEANAAYVAAANPAAILELIAENEAYASRLHEVATICATAEQERGQLRAEVDGLKTGYQAYERVNAELKAEVEKLRGVMACVVNEVPCHEDRNGNAPGHCHSIPGVWDQGNGAKSGTECGWCKAWNAAVAMKKEEQL